MEPDRPSGSRIRVRMRARATDEPHRASSPLELLFDLTFVVAVAAITAQLAHGIADGHGVEELPAFLQVFFAIWWAWVNFTWFASSYDTDDVPYRLMTMVQMAGVLVLAAGVPAAFEDGDYLAVTLGYLVMRVGLVAQWVRAAVEDPAGRRTALRYAGGITVLQVLWVLRLLLDESGLLPGWSLIPVFLLLVALELSVPRWAERARTTNWHPHHIAERYGLFTIILLGESVLAASNGATAAVEAGGVSGPLLAVALSALIVLFALWWLYFLEPSGEGLAASRDRSYLWGYGHYGIFAALAAVGAGLEVAVEAAGHDVAASPVGIGYAVAVPVAVFLVLLWAVHAPIVSPLVIRPAALLGAAGVVVLLPPVGAVTGPAPVVAGVAAACAVVVVTAMRSRPRARRASPGS